MNTSIVEFLDENGIQYNQNEDSLILGTLKDNAIIFVLSIMLAKLNCFIALSPESTIAIENEIANKQITIGIV